MEQLLGQVLGPLGALALAVLVLAFAYRVWQSFLSEGFVSGKTYARVVQQNAELLDLLKQSVETADTLSRKDEEQTRQLWARVVPVLPSPGSRPPERRRSRARVSDEVEALEQRFERG